MAALSAATPSYTAAEHTSVNATKHFTFSPPIMNSILEPAQIQAVLRAVNEAYHARESSDHPAAGYQMHLRGYAGGKPRAYEASLSEVEEREADSPMDMPPLPPKGCVFCGDKVKVVKEYESEDSLAKPIVTLSKNILVISKDHYGHMFEAPLEVQESMASLAMDIFSRKGISDYQVFAHVGTHGHQTVGHAHMHLLSGLKEDDGKENAS